MGVGGEIMCYLAAYAMLGWMYVLYIGYSDRGHMGDDDLFLWLAFVFWPLFVATDLCIYLGDAVSSIRERLNKDGFVMKVFKALAMCVKVVFNPHWLGQTLKERFSKK